MKTLFRTLLLTTLVGLLPFLSIAQKSLSFDGTNDYVRVADNKALDLNSSGTLEAWVYSEAYQTTAGIIHKGDKGDWTDEAYSLELNSSGDKIDLYLTAAGVSQNKLSSTTTIQLNKWYHVVATWNSTNVYLFINGNLESSSARTVTPQNSAGGLNIGCQLNEVGNYKPFKGKLDEIRIWNIYRSQSDIRDNMYKVLAGNESGLVLYFNFDGSGSSTPNLSDEPKIIEKIELTSSGTDYTTFPTITISGGGGTGATANVANMKVGSASVAIQGSGYAVNNILSITNGTYSVQAKLKVLSVKSGKVTSVSINDEGNYTSLPTNSVNVSSSSGSNAKFNLGWGVNSVTLTNSGSGYTSIPTITFSPPGAAATATISDYSGVFYNGASVGNGINSGPLWTTTNYSPLAHIWFGGNSTDWNTTSNWFGNWLPYNKIPVNISNSATKNCVLAANAECEKLTIESSRSLTINPSYTLKANGNTKIDGQLILDANTTNTGCFIDNGTIAYGSSAVVNVKRILTNNKWHYTSSPINNATANVFMGCAVYRYEESDGSKGQSVAWKAITAGTVLNNMQGYDVYVKNTDKTVTFSGQLNTGSFSNNALGRAYDGFNYVGNPYASAIDWDATTGWTKTNLDNAIYIWDPAANSGNGNYMSYVNGQGTNGGSNLIAPTQAFWVKVSAGKSIGGLTVNNNSRVTNSVKYRSTEDLIKISCTTSNFTDETILVFNENATEDFDNMHDANKFFVEKGDGSMIYTKADDEVLSINSLPSITGQKSIPLYTKVLGSNLMNLKVDGLENIDLSFEVLLEDTKTNTFTNLRLANYTYTSEINDQEARFIIHFIPAMKINQENTTTDISDSDANHAEIYSFNNSIYVNVENADNNTTLSVYDLNGKELIHQAITSGLNKIEASNISGAVIVKVISENINTASRLMIQ